MEQADKKVNPKPTLLALLCVFCLTLALDQITKLWVVAKFERYEVLPVIDGFFNLILTYNKGAAFGMFADLPDGTRQIVLAITTSAALLAVLYFLAKDYKDNRTAQVAMSLILAGAAGNLIDRVRLGEVIDFLDVYLGQYHWPAFNVADSAICIGVTILLFLGLFPSKNSGFLK